MGDKINLALACQSVQVIRIKLIHDRHKHNFVMTFSER